MKNKFIFLILLLLFSTLITGNAREDHPSINPNKIVVQKNSREIDTLRYFRTVSDNDKIREVIEVLEKATWENAEAEMISPPHYAFYFDENDSEIYKLWISPNKDKIELVAEGYAQLTKEASTQLFKIMTDQKLTDVQ